MSGVVAGNPWAGLPGRLREEDTGAAARRRGRAIKRTIIPGSLGDVGKHRSAIGIVAGIPISRAAFLKLCTADAGDLRNTSGSIDGKSAIPSVIAIGAAAVARRR